MRWEESLSSEFEGWVPVLRERREELSASFDKHRSRHSGGSISSPTGGSGVQLTSGCRAGDSSGRAGGLLRSCRGEFEETIRGEELTLDCEGVEEELLTTTL